MGSEGGSYDGEKLVEVHFEADGDGKALVPQRANHRILAGREQPSHQSQSTAVRLLRPLLSPRRRCHCNFTCRFTCPQRLSCRVMYQIAALPSLLLAS